jgi:hypothetical protein
LKLQLLRLLETSDSHFMSSLTHDTHSSTLRCRCLQSPRGQMEGESF